MTLPVACSLTSPALAERMVALRTGVFASAIGNEALASGYRWQFATTPDLLARLGGVLDAERSCCRFLHIRLEAEPDLGITTLDVTGPPGHTRVSCLVAGSPAVNLIYLESLHSRGLHD